MKRLFLIAILSLAFAGQSQATLPVVDYSSIIHNIYSQVVNYIQYLEHTANQITQIENQITQIENQVIALERFGNPQYYVNLLHLDQFMASASVLTNGVGNTIAQYRQAANGVLALGYTADGIYTNLQGTLDRFGNTVQYAPNNFRKFQAFNDMYDGFNTELRTYNTQTASLQQQLSVAMQNLNSAATQMEVAKYSAQISAINAQISALGHRSTLVGQRATMQLAANQNDAARTQEATLEQKEQERRTDLQNLANGMSGWVSGGGDTKP
jgi:hypothetical protein